MAESKTTVLRTYVHLAFNSAVLTEAEGPSRLNCLSQRQGAPQPRSISGLAEQRADSPWLAFLHPRERPFPSTSFFIRLLQQMFWGAFNQ